MNPLVAGAVFGVAALILVVLAVWAADGDERDAQRRRERSRSFREHHPHEYAVMSALSDMTSESIEDALLRARDTRQENPSR